MEGNLPVMHLRHIVTFAFFVRFFLFLFFRGQLIGESPIGNPAGPAHILESRRCLYSLFLLNSVQLVSMGTGIQCGFRCTGFTTVN